VLVDGEIADLINQEFWPEVFFEFGFEGAFFWAALKWLMASMALAKRTV
jgi:hypothetical protein